MNIKYRVTTKLMHKICRIQKLNIESLNIETHIMNTANNQAWLRESLKLA